MEKRVEITADNVHTSRGKALEGERLTLPAEEADFLIGRQQARGVPGRRPAEERLGQDDAEGFDIGGGGDLGQLSLEADD